MRDTPEKNGIQYDCFETGIPKNTKGFEIHNNGDKFFITIRSSSEYTDKVSVTWLKYNEEAKVTKEEIHLMKCGFSLELKKSHLVSVFVRI